MSPTIHPTSDRSTIVTKSKNTPTPTTTPEQEATVTDVPTLETAPALETTPAPKAESAKLTGRAAALAKLDRLNGTRKVQARTRRTPSGEPKMKYHNDITEAQVAEMHAYLSEEERSPEVPYTVETARAKVQDLLRACRLAYRADWVAKLELEKAAGEQGWNFEGDVPESLTAEVAKADEARKALKRAQNAYLVFCGDLDETPGPMTGGTNPNDIRKELGMDLIHRPVKAEETEGAVEAVVAEAEASMTPEEEQADTDARLERTAASLREAAAAE